MTFFQFKSFSFINYAIKRIVKHIKSNAKKLCFLVNLTNATFWKDTPRGQEILEFFKGMTQQQIIPFFGCFDIFVVGFHNVINGFIEMTADPLSRNFEKTLWVSISKGYNRFTERCSGRATPSIECDLRSSIGSTPVQSAGFSTSPASGFQNSSVENAFKDGLSTFGPFLGFGAGHVNPFSPFQGFGEPASNFSLFSAQVPSFGGHFQPIAQGGLTNPLTSQCNLVSVQPMNNMGRRESKGKLAIKKERVIHVEIPSDFSSGQSTSSTVGISKSPKVPKAKTPVATTIANLEKKIARLESENPAEGSSDYLTLVVSMAKLEKLQNSL
jgi:hypothetical protein